MSLAAVQQPPPQHRTLSQIRADYYFDREEAWRVVQFFERELHHVEGELAGLPVYLERWQKRILRRFFGWKRREDGFRRYRVLYLEVPRKNGKSLLGAGIALYLLLADREPGAKVVSAASDREQAGLVYDVAKKMVEMNPKLQRKLKPFLRTMVTTDRMCKYEVVSADVRRKHGKNLHGIIFDELHAQPSRDLVDVLNTSMGARRQPVEVYLTTAGDNKNSICWEYHTRAVNVRKGLIEADNFLGFVYGLDDKEKWREEKNWYKANPNLGVSVKLEDMRSHCAKAVLSPQEEITFKRLRLNIWTEPHTRWLPVERWEECYDPTIADPESLLGEECYAGLDLGQTQDITALVLAFPRPGARVALLQWLWVPEDTIGRRARQDQIDYTAWVAHGHLQVTPGVTTDYNVVRDVLRTVSEQYFIREIGIDRVGAYHLGNLLAHEDGMEVVMLSQNFSTMSAPTRRLEELILSPIEIPDDQPLPGFPPRQLAHDGNLVMRWMFSNIAAVTDPDNNIRFSKKRSRDKIDGMSATVNALSRLILRTGSGDSVYNERGIVVV